MNIIFALDFEKDENCEKLAKLFTVLVDNKEDIKKSIQIKRRDFPDYEWKSFDDYHLLLKREQDGGKRAKRIVKAYLDEKGAPDTRYEMIIKL